MLTACGGGGGGDSSSGTPPNPPNPPAPPAPAGVLQFESPTYSLDEATATITVRITRTGGSNGVVSVTVTSAPATATAGQDYAASTTTLTFAAGDTATQQVAWPVVEDALFETDETFLLQLSAPTGGATLGANTTATITIRNDDVAPPPPPPPARGTIQFGAANFDAAESIGLASIVVTRTGGSDGVVSARFSSTNGTATSPGDFPGPAMATVTFADGDSNPKTLVHPITADTLDESNETILLTLSDPTGGATLGAQNNATLTILDDDTTLPPGPVTAFLDVSGKQLQFGWMPGTADTQRYRLMEDAHGTGTFVQVGADIGAGDFATILPIAIFRHDWENARYRIDACNVGGCTPSNVLDTRGRMLHAILFLVSFGDFNDRFGISVAISGDGRTIAVGVPLEASSVPGVGGAGANNDAPAAGAVFMFTRAPNNGGWLSTNIKASNAQLGDGFGQSVALNGDGNVLAVGAHGEDGAGTGVTGDPGNDSTPAAGAAYIFERAGGTWAETAYLKATNTEQSDLFGFATALSADGDTLAVSAIHEDSSATGVGGDTGNNDELDSGAVYVYGRSPGGDWAPQAYIKASNADVGDLFGVAVSLSGDGSTLGVSSILEASAATGIDGNQADVTAPGAGAVYVFARPSGGTWAQQAYVKASNTGAGDNFGDSFAFSHDGATLAVGAPFEDSGATGIGGNQIDDTVDDAGAVYVFTRTQVGAWSQQVYVKATNTEQSDWFGSAVSLSASGNTLAVGAPEEDSDAVGINGDQSNNNSPGAGAAYVYDRSMSGVWSAQSYVKARINTFGQFGFALGVSNDGNSLVVTAPATNLNEGWAWIY